MKKPESADHDGSAWDDAIGPFYEAATVLTRLGLTDDEFARAVEAGEILAVTAGTATLYPAFQFGEADKPLPGLNQVCTVLAEALDNPWDALVSPNADTGLSAADELRAGRIDHVVTLTRHDVARWTQ